MKLMNEYSFIYLSELDITLDRRYDVQINQYKVSYSIGQIFVETYNRPVYNSHD